LGSSILRKFLRDVVFANQSIDCCVIGPEPQNKAAIKAYEKAGFRYLKTVQISGEEQPEYLMRLSREDLISG
jgi:RimJ/RimL family protein N-acetyltransferase